MPTEEEESQDPEHADQRYAACVAELRRLTRNKERYGLVHKRLIDYGFRRNMLGLKWIGIGAGLTVPLLGGLYMWWKWDPAGLNILLLAVAIVSTALAVGWLTLVSESSVELGAERYANALLEAAVDME